MCVCLLLQDLVQSCLQLIFRDQNYVSIRSNTLCMCIYTMSIHSIYTVSDLEGSDNGIPLYGIIYCR
jgi:hypothetical protein